MCGRYSLATPQALQRRFELDEPLAVPADPNIAPSQQLPVIVDEAGKRRAVLMEWGLIPHWARPGRSGERHRTINARAETVATKPSYRVPFRRRRCLVPASGFFEWRKEGGRSLPYYLHLKREPLLAFAGLYDIWVDAEGTSHRTFAIITTEANSLVAPIHDRMPAILHRVDEELWLDPEVHDPAALEPLLRPYPPAEMEAYPVSTAVNRPDSKDPRLLLSRAS